MSDKIVEALKNIETHADVLMKIPASEQICARVARDEAEAHSIQRVVRCPGCKNEIDPDVCHCGDYRAAHDSMNNHSFVPMGCDCGRVKMPENLNDLGI